MTNTIHINIEGMTCGHCTSAVLTALKSIEGVTHATVDLATKKGTVEYADEHAHEGLKHLIVEKVTAAGYTAEVV
jgi:copper chaperone CopZ